MQSSSPILWIVATPLGNPGDLSPRSQEILKEADLVLAEDTRRSRRLFSQLGISPKKLDSFHDHNEDQKRAGILKALAKGAKIALVSDAGTPLLADPGYRLVRAARNAGFTVSPAPGPSAPIAALSAAGLPPIPFSFLGFLPRAKSDRIELFDNYRHVPGSLIFFERKDRVSESLMDAYEVFGDREVVICRELTKPHEEFICGSLEKAAELCQNLLGEMTIIIGPAREACKSPLALVLKLLERETAMGKKPRDAARAVQKSAQGWKTGELYELLTSRSCMQNN